MKSHALNAFYQRAWAIEPNAYSAIEDLLHDREHGIRASPEELDAWEAASPYGTATSQQAGGSDVAIIPLHGPMLANASGMQRLSGLADTRQFATAVRAAAVDKAVREIVLDIDSPGGEVASVDVASDAIAYARKRKAVTAVTSGMMASAAYWIAAQADRIVASPNAAIGSISVIYTHVDRTARDEQDGVKVTYLTTGPKKALGNPHEPLGDEARAEANRLLAGYHDAFIQAIATGRDRDPDWVQANWADGRVEIGTTAKQIGMVDEIGTIHDVLTRIQTEVNTTARTPMRVKGDTVTLKDMHALISNAPRAEAETDDGIKSVVALDANVADELATSLEDASQELEQAHAQTEEAKATAETAQAEAQAMQRRQLAAESLAKSNLPPVSVERDAAFAAELADQAVKADTGDAAQQAVDARIAERRADLHATRSDNTPGLPDTKPNARANEAKRALSSIRRTTGLPN